MKQKTPREPPSCLLPTDSASDPRDGLEKKGMESLGHLQDRDFSMEIEKEALNPSLEPCMVLFSISCSMKMLNYFKTL